MPRPPLLLITRAEKQGVKTADLFARLIPEVEVLHLPLLPFAAMRIDVERRQILDYIRLGQYSWGIFSSANGVSFFAQAGGILPEGFLVAAQGQATADCFELKFRRKVDFIPQRSVAGDFIAELLPQILADKKGRVVVVGARERRPVIEKRLSEEAVLHDFLPVYETSVQIPDLGVLQRLADRELLITFFSPSAVNAAQAVAHRHQDSAFAKSLPTARVISIGKVTSDAVRAAGLNLVEEAEEQSDEGMVLACRKELARSEGTS